MIRLIRVIRGQIQKGCWYKKFSAPQRLVREIHVLRRARCAGLSEQEVAALLAVAARLRADAAVIVHLGVALAFISTALAGRDAGVELRVEDLADRLGLSREHAGGGAADVGAIEIGANAAAEFFELRFAEAGIGAGGADFSAGGKGAQGFRIGLDALRVRVRMSAEHHFNGFHAGNLPAPKQGGYGAESGKSHRRAADAYFTSGASGPLGAT